jgi:hypothetical protein
MLAGGKFRNHAAIRSMDCDLRGHNARQYATPTLYYCGCGLITGTFDGENQAAARGICAFSSRE